MTQAVVNHISGRSPAELGAEMRNPLTTIWNAVYMLSLDSELPIAEQVRDIVARQVVLLTDIAEELQEKKL